MWLSACVPSSVSATEDGGGGDKGGTWIPVLLMSFAEFITFAVVRDAQVSGADSDACSVVLKTSRWAAGFSHFPLDETLWSFKTPRVILT